MEVINTGFVLSRFLRYRDQCDFRDLSEMKMKIQKTFPNVYVKINKNEIFSYLNHYPEIFSYDGNVIKKAEGSEKYFVDGVIDYFNDPIPEDLKQDIIKFIENDK